MRLLLLKREGSCFERKDASVGRVQLYVFVAEMLDCQMFWSEGIGHQDLKGGGRCPAAVSKAMADGSLRDLDRHICEICNSIY
jgi:hypothetical protein